MTADLISKATRNEFREVLVGFTLREIDMIFEAGGLVARSDYVPPVSGQRRSLVEQYYASINFNSPTDIRRLLGAYEEAIEQLTQAQSRVVNPDAVDQTIETLLRRMERDGFSFQNQRFHSERLSRTVVEAASLIALTEESITEHVNKARSKIEAGDNAGAIASAYTLVEGFLKELLRRTDVTFKQDEGDIRELYKAAAGPLNLNPPGENLESYLKSILQGLKSQVTGLYELANKASDRHVRRYNPSRHHAKLAVSAAFTLCEFLLDSYEYQAQRKERKAAS
jgi:HEPN domain-containing protein